MNAKPSRICLTLNDTEIPYSNNIKHLGDHIDSWLNFQAHKITTEQRSIGIIVALHKRVEPLFLFDEYIYEFHHCNQELLKKQLYYRTFASTFPFRLSNAACK